MPHVSEISSPYGLHAGSQVARSGQVAFANVTFDGPATKLSASAAKAFVNTARRATSNGLEVEVDDQLAEVASQTGLGAVPLGFLFAAAVLFVVFGSPLAMLLPLLAAAVSLGTAVGAIGLLSHVIEMPTFASEQALLIGLGVGVDYALFILTRYRQAVLRGLDRGRLHCNSCAHAAAGIARHVRDACAAPAGAALAQRRRRASRRRADGVAELGRGAAAAPGTVAALAVTLLALIAIPFFSMRLGSADAGLDPAGWTTHKAYALLATGFGAGYNGPLQLVAEISGPAHRASFIRLEQAVARTPGVAGATQPQFLLGRSSGPPR